MAGQDRRSRVSEPRLPARRSPANALLGGVAVMLAATAAATAVLGVSFDGATPHGQVLGALRDVAEAQERHYQEVGTFATWAHTLRSEVTADVRITILRADATGWHATARHADGLSCSQGGELGRRGEVVRTRPICYTEN